MSVPNQWMPSLSIFEEMESEVRSYIRSFPTLFCKAKGDTVWDTDGKAYIDFFAGAGALNYGHNHPQLKEALLEYISQDGVIHSLDMGTRAKAEFLHEFRKTILEPRGYDYKVMFPGPTGTNAVESALKLARKVTGRESIISFTNGFHGMTLGSLSVTANRFKRGGAGVPLHHTVSMPYDGYLGNDVDTCDVIEQYIADNGSGMSLPAAVIVETVQGEGGVNVANLTWLARLEQICRTHGVLLIVDDVQMGCGRTGEFFSFEEANITPDIVCLSKSISGFGLPMALTLFRPDLDQWQPGEHNGTFRGNNAAFVTAKASLEFWQGHQLPTDTFRKGKQMQQAFSELHRTYPELIEDVRGRGMVQGLVCKVEGLAERICQGAFERGLLVETSGPNSEVVKLLPPLTVDPANLSRGLQIIADSVASCVPVTV